MGNLDLQWWIYLSKSFNLWWWGYGNQIILDSSDTECQFKLTHEHVGEGRSVFSVSTLLKVLCRYFSTGVRIYSSRSAISPFLNWGQETPFSPVASRILMLWFQMPAKISVAGLFRYLERSIYISVPRFPSRPWHCAHPIFEKSFFPLDASPGSSV